MVQPGSLLGPYEIVAPLGAGGMGEVYRACDTRLDRLVALKLLPPGFAGDAERVARFSREARALAAVSHPGIAAVYGFEQVEGRSVLAMELVEGEDLSERISRGPLPVDETLAIARQIAEALEEAHEKGIVHRDLKPANVKLCSNDQVKLLDFGLAKAWKEEDARSSPSLVESPTVSVDGTSPGMILGTAAYMSPEQARGKPVDKRTDIWAFGVVLYEMLSGRKLFSGDTVADVLARILTGEPDWSALPASTPPSVDRLLRRCVERDPKQRLRDIGEARIALEAVEDPAPAKADSSRRRSRRDALPWALALLAAAIAGWLLLAGRGAPRRALTLAVLPPLDTVSSGPIDLSPDGRQITFTSVGSDGKARLYVRMLDALEERALPGTEGADAPFFSPDGRSIGFFADMKLKRIDLGGGPPRELADAPDHRGGSWGSQNIIVFSPKGGSPIYRVSAGGGEATPVTKLEQGTQESSHRWPHFLPDGKRFLFMSRKPRPPGRLAVEVGSIDGRLRTRLLESSTSGAFARGQLYFVRGSTLLSQALDSRTLTLSGDPASVAEDVWRNPGTDGLTAFAVTEEGTIAYRRGGVALSQLTWLDRQGQRLGTLGPSAIIGTGGLSLTPDDRWALVDVAEPGNDVSPVFAIDLASEMTTRVTFGEGNQVNGRYSPDGHFVVFASDSSGTYDLYRQEVGSPGEPSAILSSNTWKFPESLSSDGRFLSYSQSDPGKATDIWILPMTGDAKPFPFAETPANESGSAFSPDGRFLAYVSDESGRNEVFVRTFPASSGKWQVSTGGGSIPVWRGNGREIFYLASDGQLVAVPVTLKPGEFQAGEARPLFRLTGLFVSTIAGAAPFAATADGQRFLANLVVGEEESSPIVIRTGERP